MSLKTKITQKYHIAADYSKWKGKWIHYSKFPTLKINPKQFHQDPAGLYFFPEAFKTEGSWTKSPYKFEAEMPSGLNILDLAHVDADKSIGLVTGLGAATTDEKSEWPRFKKQIEETKERLPVDIAWEYLQRFFMGKPGLWNKRLREMGFDAVFDDTKSVHGAEIQLIVLDPRKLKNVRRIDKTGSGYDVVVDICKEIAALGKPFGNVKNPPPKKKFSNWDKRNEIIGEVEIKAGEDHYSPYVLFEVNANPDVYSSGKKFKNIRELEKAHFPADQISVRVKYSNPDLSREPRYYDTSYQADVRDVKMNEIKKMVAGVLNEIFVVRQEKKE